SGCKAGDGQVEMLRAHAQRDTSRASRSSAEGLTLVEARKFAEAEVKFRDAIAADPFCGPCHCNLGLTLLQQKKLYDAAWELQFACRLMPKASQPRANLGILYESAGRFTQADEALREALALSPDDLDVIGLLARVQVRQGKSSPELKNWLATIAVRDD